MGEATLAGNRLTREHSHLSTWIPKRDYLPPSSAVQRITFSHDRWISATFCTDLSCLYWLRGLDTNARQTNPPNKKKMNKKNAKIRLISALFQQSAVDWGHSIFPSHESLLLLLTMAPIMTAEGLKKEGHKSYETLFPDKMALLLRIGHSGEQLSRTFFCENGFKYGTFWKEKESVRLSFSADSR